MVVIVALGGAALGASLPEGYWSNEQARAILDKTLTLRLDPDLSHLSAAERTAIENLIEAGRIFQQLYERQRHPEAETAHAKLLELSQQPDSMAETQDLLTLYQLFKGPIATTLDNRREAFLPVEPESPGKNVYPTRVSREELETFFAAHPERRNELLDVRSVVRRSSEDNLEQDLSVLSEHPVLDVLHPGLRTRLERMRGNWQAEAFYAVPYSVAYSEEILSVYRLLQESAESMASLDGDFAAYLENRARDLLADDYEAGDASWLTGSFDNLNAEIGSYETYDDELFGVKSFFALSLLVRDQERSTKLEGALAGLQDIENSLPYEHHKKVRADIPVGVYRVIADFGQARGANTASILPNEPDHARKYGRTILLRYNLLTHPDDFAAAHDRFRVAVAPEQGDDLTLEGRFEFVLWHEVGHYLGVDVTAAGELLDAALAQYSSLLEEMKSDLVSLFSARSLLDHGYFTEGDLRSVYASGVLRVLQDVEPRREQPYQTMQLMQWNYFLENGLLRFDARTGRLAIDYDRYHEVVSELLEQVLAVQRSGDPARAAAFVDRWGYWREEPHEAVAERLRDALEYRYTLVQYAALEE